MKTWKTIPKFPKYEASNLGEIKTFNWKNHGIERIMKPALDKFGHLRTVLVDNNGKHVTVKVHRIIAETFIPNPENKPCVNHINAIPFDNRIENLEWCTHSENMKHAYLLGRMTQKGEKNTCATLTDAQALEILQNYNFGKKARVKGQLTKRQIAEKYNVSVNVIKQLVQRKTWKHLSFTPKT